MKAKRLKSIGGLIIMSIILGSNLNAQNIISGHIYNLKNNEALVGASVYFPDLHKGNVTNASGEFTIKDVPNGTFDLLFRYIGYKNKILKLKTDTCTHKLVIYMEEEAFQSQEIIVSGSRFSLQHENAIEVSSMNVSATSGESNLTAQIANLPGVDLSSKGQGITKPVIRGLSNTNVLFIDNGVRTENFQFSEDHPFMVDEFGTARIEVIKGPASLLYGSDAVGGVLFAVREKPESDKAFAGDYTIQYNTNSQGMQSSLNLQTAQKRFHAGIRASFKAHQDYTDGNDRQVPNTRFNQNSVKSVIGFTHKRGNFDLYYDYTDMQLGLSILPSINLITDNSYDNNIWYQSLTNHVIALRNKLFFNKVKFDINADYQSNNRKLMTVETAPVFKVTDMLLNTLNVDLKSSFELSKGEFIVGVQSMYQTNSNADAPNHVIPDAQVFDASALSLYAVDFTKDIHFQGGLRYDFRHIQTDAETDKAATDNYYRNVSFSSGATYQLHPDLLLRLNFASAHRTPNIAELTQNGLHGAYYERGNANLSSQYNFEPDLSLHYHTKNFIYEISGYYNQIYDYIYLGKTTELTADNIAIYEYMQTDARITGFEIGTKYQPVSYIRLHADYAFINAKQENGDYLPFIPQNKLKFGFKLLSKKLLFADNPFFSADMIYASEQNHPANFETETPAYNIVNLSFGFSKQFKISHMDFSGGVRNLFNKAYFDHLSTLKDLGYTQIGRDIYLSLKLKF